MRIALLLLVFSANAQADETPSCPASPALEARIAALTELAASQKKTPELKAKLREGYDALVLDFPNEPGAYQARIQFLTLPIYLAKQLTDDFMQVQSVPRSWIVDSKGVLVEQLVGFEETATWAEDMLQRLQKL